MPRGNANSCNIEAASNEATVCLYHPYLGTHNNSNYDENCGKYILIKAANGKSVKAQVVDKHSWNAKYTMINKVGIDALDILANDEISWQWIN